MIVNQSHTDAQIALVHHDVEFRVNVHRGNQRVVRSLRPGNRAIVVFSKDKKIQAMEAAHFKPDIKSWQMTMRTTPTGNVAIEIKPNQDGSEIGAESTGHDEIPSKKNAPKKKKRQKKDRSKKKRDREGK